MKKVFLGVFLLLLIFLGLGGFLFSSLSRSVSTDINTKNFVINKGDTLSTIATRLEENHLIQNRYVFMALAYRLGLNRQIQAGLFRISPSLTAAQVAVKLSKGGSHDYWFKIIEGQRVEEIPQGFGDDNPLLPSEFLVQAKAQEGYLFPDSYLIPQNYSVDNILSLIRRNFDKKISEASLDQNNGLSLPQSVVLASIVEREARTPPVKQMIAGIYLNRLKASMPLQADATAQYVRDSKLPQNANKKYWLPATKADLSLVSPYNTYLNPGLPPGPICNPGYDSLYAAFHPTASDYLFYITDNNGQIHYAKTLDEHNANIAKYLK